MDSEKAYLQHIERHRRGGFATEETHRPALMSLVESLAKRVCAINAPRRIACGAPDFVITRDDVPIGYIETKEIGTALDNAERSDQLCRYRSALGNLVLTDYLEFRWYLNGERRLKARLGMVDQGEIVLSDEGMADVRELLDAFLATQTPSVVTPSELARLMAYKSRLLRDAIAKALEGKDKGGALRGQLKSFRDILLPDLTEAKFADMYAQTICYGLFLARYYKTGPGPFTRKDASWHIPKSNPFMREVFHHIAGPDLDDRAAWVADDMATMFDWTDMAAVLKGFGSGAGKEDPVIHFYETYLGCYDPQLRRKLGVYYTPEPVVSYIVRSVDHLLRVEFGLDGGLANSSKVQARTNDGKHRDIHQVQILDPAAGTGTSLHHVVRTIFEKNQGNRGLWPGYVAEHLLPRVHGFEILMAPYTVAHLKLDLLLQTTGYTFQSNERLRIFLTNTLIEPSEIETNVELTNSLSLESLNAKRVKRDMPLMIILGNPPYAGESQNKDTLADDLLRGIDPETGQATHNYFQVDGQPLAERNPKWLNNDYVKFIRYAQWQIERTGYGILAFITDNSYLDSPTFRGMRQSLLDSFDDLYLLNLHGNAKKKETAPGGGPDKNVFEIQQGVAIGIFVRKPHGLSETKRVFYEDLWGKRDDKFHWLAANELSTTKWNRLEPRSGSYFLVPTAKGLGEEYEAWWSLADIFPVSSVGIVTARDKLTIGFTADEVSRTVRDFAGLPEDIARKKYNLGKDVRDWKVHLAQEDLRKSGCDPQNVVPILYRPFDLRYTFYTAKTRGFICMPRPEVMSHMLRSDNVALLTTRQTKDDWVCFATRYICGHKASSRYDISSIFPLYLYPKLKGGPFLLDETTTRKPNVDERFVREFEAKLSLNFVPNKPGNLETTFGPEDLLYYAYGIFYSPGYRSRYAEFLKRDFPRLPLTTDRKLFLGLCRLGRKVASLHLGRIHGVKLPRFPVPGTNLVENIHYTEPGQGSEEGRVWFNRTQYFEGVPPATWAFRIGGYQICKKWLSDRKERFLRLKDLEDYRAIVANIEETRSIMDEIDSAIESSGGWPLKGSQRRKQVAILERPKPEDSQLPEARKRKGLQLD